MRFDIYFSGGWRWTEDFSALTNGTDLAVVAEAKIDHPGEVLHARVTEEQLARLRKDNIPFDVFSDLPIVCKSEAAEKIERGSPPHVFGGFGKIVSPPDDKGYIEIFESRKATSEKLSLNEEKPIIEKHLRVTI